MLKTSQKLLWQLAASLILALPIFAQTYQASNRRTVISPESREQVRKIIPAIGLVQVRVPEDADKKLRPRGSAVVIRKDGLVITNLHVVMRDNSTKLFDEIYLSLPENSKTDAATVPKQYRLTSLLLNEERDLALMRIVPKDQSEPLNLPVIEFADANKLDLLDDLFILGFPEKGGTTITVNYGVVEGRDALDEWIKTDARLIHGNSGGAAVDASGKLIGIPTRVEVDRDEEKTYGAVGYLRPINLVTAMITRWQEQELRNARMKAVLAGSTKETTPMKVIASNAEQFKLFGTVRSIQGKPLTGVKVGLALSGKEYNSSDLISWCESNAEGQFSLENTLPVGRYNLRAKADGFDSINVEMNLTKGVTPITIELKPSR